MSQYDVAVIGGGAAGLSAALVLSRARRRVLVVDAGSPRNAPAAHMHGFLSRDGMPTRRAAGRRPRRGEELRRRDRRRAPSPSWCPTAERVLGPASPTGSGSRRGGCWSPPACATSCPDIPGLRERWARDVLHCPYCHGHEVRDRRLGVLGGSPGAVRYAQIVRQWTHDLVYFTPPDILTTTERSQLVARAIGVVEGDIEQLVVDDDRLRGVQMDDGCVVPRDALFVPPRFVPNNELLVDLGCARRRRLGHPTPPAAPASAGVWAAGNVVDPRAQVITAAGAGSAAAIALNADLVERRRPRRRPRLQPRLPVLILHPHPRAGATMTNPAPTPTSRPATPDHRPSTSWPS